MWKDDLGGKKACVLLLLFCWGAGWVLVPLTKEVRARGVVERERWFPFWICWTWFEHKCFLCSARLEKVLEWSWNTLRHTCVYMIHYLKIWPRGKKKRVEIAVRSNVWRLSRREAQMVSGVNSMIGEPPQKRRQWILSNLVVKEGELKEGSFWTWQLNHCRSLQERSVGAEDESWIRLYWVNQ